MLGALTLFLGVPGEARELYERAWVEARSPNFVVYSSRNEKATRTLTQELEDFRQLVGILTTAEVLEPRVPTLLFVFPGKEPDFGLTETIAGWFYPGLRANYAVVRPAPGMALSHAIQHEYAHFLMRNQGKHEYPKWYDEGFAELLATVNLRDGQFDLGNFATGRIYTLQKQSWMTPARLLDDTQVSGLTRRDGAIFYAQSWALVHYLTWGRTGRTFGTDLDRYLAARERGLAPVPAFEESFEEPTAELNARVRKYLERARYFRGELKQPFAATGITTRALPRDGIANALGHLCIATGRTKGARPYIEAALAANPENPDALVNMADLHKFDRDVASAQPLYEKAIALNPQSDLHHLDFGEFWLDRAGATTDPVERGQFLSLARREFVAADKLNDRNPETLAVYGRSFLLEGEPAEKGVETLELAHQLLPSHPTIKWLLASAYIRLNRPDEARPLLRAMRAWSEGEGAAAAEKLLAEIGEETGDDPAMNPPEETDEDR